AGALRFLWLCARVPTARGCRGTTGQGQSAALSLVRPGSSPEDLRRGPTDRWWVTSAARDELSSAVSPRAGNSLSVLRHRSCQRRIAWGFVQVDPSASQGKPVVNFSEEIG